MWTQPTLPPLGEERARATNHLQPVKAELRRVITQKETLVLSGEVRERWGRGSGSLCRGLSFYHSRGEERLAENTRSTLLDLNTGAWVVAPVF